MRQGSGTACWRWRLLAGDAGTTAACGGARGRDLRTRVVMLQEVLEAGDAGARFPLELEGEGCVHSGAAVGWFGARRLEVEEALRPLDGHHTVTGARIVHID